MQLLFQPFMLLKRVRRLSRSLEGGNGLWLEAYLVQTCWLMLRAIRLVSTTSIEGFGLSSSCLHWLGAIVLLMTLKAYIRLSSGRGDRRGDGHRYRAFQAISFRQELFSGAAFSACRAARLTGTGLLQGQRDAYASFVISMLTGWMLKQPFARRT